MSHEHRHDRSRSRHLSTDRSNSALSIDDYIDLLDHAPRNESPGSEPNGTTITCRITK